MSAAPGWDRFARALAGRTDTIRILDTATGYRAGPWPLQEPDQPYAVHLADTHGRFRVLAFDLDAKTPALRHRVGPDLSQLEFLLAHAGARHVTVASGPGGGRHVLVPFSTPLPHQLVREIAATLSRRLESLDISMLANHRTGALRPPGALHPAGGRSRLMGDHEAALRLLETGNDREVAVRIVELLDLDPLLLRDSRPPLSPRLWRALHHGEGWSPRDSLSELVHQMFCSTLSRGYDPAWLHRALRSPEHALSRELARHRKPSDGTVRDLGALLRTTERKARTFVLEHPAIRGASDARAEIEAIAQRARRTGWTGRAGLSALAVLEVHLGRARRVGGVVYNLAQRETAEEAGLRTRRAVDNANRLLVSMGFLRLERNGYGTYATTWRLRQPGGDTRGAGNALLEPMDTGPVGHPLFAWRELGKSPARVLEVLRQDGASAVAHIARRTGLHPGTVRRGLARLEDLPQPLVRRCGRGRYELRAAPETLEETLDEVAESTGALASQVGLVLRHVEERRLYRIWWAGERAARAGPRAA